MKIFLKCRIHFYACTDFFSGSEHTESHQSTSTACVNGICTKKICIDGICTTRKSTQTDNLNALGSNSIDPIMPDSNFPRNLNTNNLVGGARKSTKCLNEVCQTTTCHNGVCDTHIFESVSQRPFTLNDFPDRIRVASNFPTLHEPSSFPGFSTISDHQPEINTGYGRSLVCVNNICKTAYSSF